MNQRRHHHQGFTLVEILISLGILSVLMSSALSFMSSSIRVTSGVNVSNRLLKESQVSQAIVSNLIRQACYAYPNGQTLNLGANYSLKNPASVSGWLIGTHPMMALILPPKPFSSTPLDYRFVAVYALPKAGYVSAAPILSAPPLTAPNNILMVLERPFRNVQVNGFDSDDNDATPPVPHASPITCETLATSGTLGGLWQGSSPGSFLLDDVEPNTTVFQTIGARVQVSWRLLNGQSSSGSVSASFGATMLNHDR